MGCPGPVSPRARHSRKIMARQPGVGGDPFALLDEQHVPGDELTRGHGLFAAVPQHPCPLRKIGPQRLDRPDRLAFLNEREQRAQRDHGEDHPAQGGRPRGEGQHPAAHNSKASG